MQLRCRAQVCYFYGIFCHNKNDAVTFCILDSGYKTLRKNGTNDDVKLKPSLRGTNFYYYSLLILWVVGYILKRQTAARVGKGKRFEKARKPLRIWKYGRRRPRRAYRALLQSCQYVCPLYCRRNHPSLKIRFLHILRYVTNGRPISIYPRDIINEDIRGNSQSDGLEALMVFSFSFFLFGILIYRWILSMT